MLLTIIVPVFNEATSVVEVVERLLGLQFPPGIDTQIIIVDDGSTDGTSELLRRYADCPPVEVHYSVLNFGKGEAVRVVLRQPLAAGRGGTASVRVRLVGGPAQPALGHRRRAGQTGR